MFQVDEIMSTAAFKENDEFFLDMIKVRPCLYDKTLKEYQDKIVTENAMEEIAFIMQEAGNIHFYSFALI